MHRAATSALAGFALAFGPVATQAALAKEAKVKYAKTEIEKANTACVILLLLGVGGSIAGGKKTAKVVLPVTIAACVIIQAVARHKEKVLAAQRATLNAPKGTYQDTLQDQNGQSITFSGTGGANQTIDGAQLQPVKYKSIDGEQLASPVMDTGGKSCRTVSSSLSYSDGRNAGLPPQVFCRTAEGNWEPYAVKTI